MLYQQPNYFRATLILLLTSLCIFLQASPCLAASWKVAEVREGDLLIVEREGQKRKIRPYGVICPVRGQPFNDEARSLANFLCSHKNVEIIPIFNGPEGVAHVLIRIEGTKYFLNERLVGYGLAWVKPSECGSSICEEWRRLETLARKKAVGLWAAPFAVPPWEWAKEMRMEVFRRSRESSQER